MRGYDAWKTTPPEPEFKCRECGDWFFELDDDELCEGCAKCCDGCGDQVGTDRLSACKGCSDFFCPGCLDKDGYCVSCASAMCEVCGGKYQTDKACAFCRFEPSAEMDASEFNAALAKLVWAEIQTDMQNDFGDYLNGLGSFRPLLAGRNGFAFSYATQDRVNAFGIWLEDRDLTVDELLESLCWPESTVKELRERAVLAVAMKEIGEAPGSLGGTEASLRGELLPPRIAVKPV